VRTKTRSAVRYRELTDHPHRVHNDLGLFGAVNASYASDPEGAKSTTGSVFFMGGGPVLWKSHLQPTVAKATGASEYVAKKWAKEDAMSRQKRHILIHYHSVRDHVKTERIRLEWVPSKENPADGLTKPLRRENHEDFLRLLGLEEF
jgi:hypothetical protein